MVSSVVSRVLWAGTQTEPIYLTSPATGQPSERSATAHAASLMLVRQHPVLLSLLSLFTVFARVCESVEYSMSPVPFCTDIRIWLKNLIFKMRYMLFYNKLYCKSQTHFTSILGVHVYNSSKAFNVNEFSQKQNVTKRKFFLSLSLFLSFFFFHLW